MLFNDSNDSKNRYHIQLTLSMNYRAKTSDDDVSKFTHSNWTTLSYYSSPKHNSLIPKYLIHFSHSNLEHGLAILTESFSPLKSELCNRSSLLKSKSKVMQQATLFLFVIHTELAQTGLSWFELATTNQSRH